MLGRSILVVWAGAVLLAAPSLSADPRFPAPVALVAAGASPVVGLNVGLVTRPPGAARWELGCPADPAADVFGYRRDPGEPRRMLARLHASVAVTEDGGCTWTQVPPVTGTVIDAGFGPGPAGEIWMVIEIQGRVAVQFRTLPNLAVREVWRLPWTLEVENAEFAGDAEGRLLLAAYDPADAGPVVVHRTASDAEWRLWPVASGTGERPRLLPLPPSTGNYVVRLMGAGTDRLALGRDDGTFHLSNPLEGYARAVWRNPEGGFVIAVRGGMSNSVLHLDADGGVLRRIQTELALRAIDGDTNHLFGLAYALGQGPVLVESVDRGLGWSPAMNLEDIQLRSECLAVNPRCAEGCLALSARGLVKDAACAPRAQLPAATADPAGGCSASGAPSGGAGWPLLVLWAATRLRRARARRQLLALPLLLSLAAVGAGCDEGDPPAVDARPPGADASAAESIRNDGPLLDITTSDAVDSPGDAPAADLPSPPRPDGASTPPSDAAADYPGPAQEFVGDPGEPPRPFGPLCSGLAARGSAPPAALDGTLYATSRPNSAHVYFRFGSLPPTIQAAYLSLVFPGGPWATGTRQGASAGRVEVTFRDGVRFASSGSAELELRVTEASLAPTAGDPTHYLRGELLAQLRPAAGAEVVQLTIRCQ